MKEKQLMRFIKKIIIANKDNTARAQKELSELAKKLSSDGVSSELVELTNDIFLYLPYTDFNRRFLPFTKKYLKAQAETGKVCKQKLDKKETKNQTVIEPETQKGQNEKETKSQTVIEPETQKGQNEKETKNQTVIEPETQKGQNKNTANGNDISKFKNLTGGYCLPDFVYERAATVYAANGRTAEADAQATNIIKDASRGCFR